jgi:hypothetical protein
MGTMMMIFLAKKHFLGEGETSTEPGDCLIYSIEYSIVFFKLLPDDIYPRMFQFLFPLH